MLSQTSKIAIKAVIYLSGKSAERQRASIDEVAVQIDASKHTVGKALQKLAKDGVIKSMKGPSGGFFLEKNQQEQTVYDIVKSIEGEDVFVECGLGLSKCSDLRPCPIHNEYSEVRDLVVALFKEKRIIDLKDSVSKGIAFISN